MLKDWSVSEPKGTLQLVVSSVPHTEQENPFVLWETFKYCAYFQMNNHQKKKRETQSGPGGWPLWTENPLWDFKGRMTGLWGQVRGFLQTCGQSEIREWLGTLRISPRSAFTPIELQFETWWMEGITVMVVLCQPQIPMGGSRDYVFGELCVSGIHENEAAATRSFQSKSTH